MCTMGEREEVVKLAWPLPLRAVGPDRRVPGVAHVPPSKNETLPAGVPVVEVTLALNVREPP